MAVLNYTPADADDGYCRRGSGGAGSFSSTSDPAIGWYGGADAESYHAWWRIPAVARDQASVAEDAFFCFRQTSSPSFVPPGATLTGYFYGVDEDDHAAPTNVATWDADHAIHTDASVRFEFPTESAGWNANYCTWVQYWSPNLAPIANELTARALWASGNDMGFHLDIDTCNWGLASAFTFREGGVAYSKPRFMIVPDGEIWPRPIGVVMGYDAYAYTSTSHLLPLPQGMLVNEVIWCVVSVDAGKTVTWPAGWTELFDVQNGTAVGLSVGYHKVDGTEGESFLLTLSAAETITAMIFRVMNQEDPATAAPEINSPATGTSTAPDPDSVTPSGSKKWLVMVAMAHDATSASAEAADYICMTNAYFTATSQSLTIAFRWLETDAAVDPGAFTLAASQEWVAGTILIPPAGTPNHYKTTVGGVWGTT